MIGRLVTGAGALVSLAVGSAAQTGTPGPAVDVPTVWHVLGYPFEAAGMVGALFACSAARFYINAGQQVRRQFRWSIDVPVSGMVLAVSAALVIMLRPAPFGGLMLGAGAGMIGEGVFKLAQRYIVRVVPELGDDAPSSGSPDPR